MGPGRKTTTPEQPREHPPEHLREPPPGAPLRRLTPPFPLFRLATALNNGAPPYLKKTPSWHTTSTKVFLIQLPQKSMRMSMRKYIKRFNNEFIKEFIRDKPLPKVFPQDGEEKDLKCQRVGSRGRAYTRSKAAEAEAEAEAGETGARRRPAVPQLKQRRWLNMKKFWNRMRSWEKNRCIAGKIWISTTVSTKNSNIFSGNGNSQNPRYRAPEDESSEGKGIPGSA